MCILLPVSGHPMPWALEPAQFFDIQMQQVTRGFMCVAVVRSGWLQRGQTVKPCPLEESSDRALAITDGVGDLPIGLPLSPPGKNLVDHTGLGVASGLRWAWNERVSKPLTPSSG